MSNAADKVGLLFAHFATGMYRRWYWANLKDHNSQYQARQEWLGVLARYDSREIIQAVCKWEIEHGPDRPPSPLEFSDYIKPALSDQGRQSLTSIKEKLNDINRDS